MRRACPLMFAVLLLTAPGPAAHAQSDGDSPLPDRLERALREMMEDVKPTLEQALEYMRSFGAIDDPRHYELPELLPNGDIIIRRREDAPEFRPDAAEPKEAPTDPLFDPEEGVWT